MRFTRIMEDVTSDSDETSQEDVFNFLKDVVIDSASGAFKGAVNTVSDVVDGVGKLASGDYKGAVDVTARRLQNMVTGTVTMVESGVKLTGAVADSAVSGKTFITEENKAHLTNICTAGIYATIGSSLISDDSADVPSADSCPQGDACSISGVENGVFNGDSWDLQELIKAGEVDGTEHISDVDRSDAARAEFLNLHGISDTEGWEVHHVVPISEGGADDPSNMVLIDPEEHDEITKAHAEFYEWHKGK